MLTIPLHAAGVHASLHSAMARFIIACCTMKVIYQDTSTEEVHHSSREAALQCMTQ